MRLNRILLILSTLACFFAQSQNFTEFKKTNNPFQKLQISHLLWQNYLRTDVDSLKVLALEIQEFDPQNSFLDLTFFSKRILGCYWVRSGEIQRGKIQLKEALFYHQKMGDKESETEELNELGIAFYMEGDFASAKSYFESSLKVGKESNNPTHFFMAELNLAKAYDRLNLKDKARGIARHYLNEAIKRKKNESVSNAYGFLSDLALERKNLPLAKEFLDKSITCLGKTDNLFFKAQAMNNLGSYFAALGEFKQALDYFQKALELRKEINHRKGIIESYYNLGSLAYMQNDFLVAEQLFKQGLKKAESDGFTSDQVDFLEFLVEIQKEVKNKDKEIEYYRLFLDLNEKKQEILLKNQEENERLADSFAIQNSNVLAQSPPNYFWTGILVGAGAILLSIILLNYFFGFNKISIFSKRYDK